MAIGVTAVPAAADIDNCGSTRVCIWADNNFQNRIISREENLERFNFSAEDRNRNDSWANNSNAYVACAYDGLNGTGDEDTYGVNGSDSNVNPYNSDDKESMRTRFGC